MLWVTLREEPAEAEIKSHKLLLRGGYIRRVTSGIYTYLPLMWRVLRKISEIVRQEMDATGAQECLLPQLQPAELWQQSGRWDTYTKAEQIMFFLGDRFDRQLGLGPTHEEVVTAVMGELVRSYRQLPLQLYQIQTKFRDEIRPRFGLMRGREFIMKDGYSFHESEASLKETYALMDKTYSRIFQRCGLEFRAVDADSGAIGGSGSQEFMILAEAGEDEVLFTADGKYAANVEKAVSLPRLAIVDQLAQYGEFEKIATPGCDSIDRLCQALACDPSQIVKQVLYQVVFDHGITLVVLVSIRGDQEVNEVKLQNQLTKLAPNYGGKTILAVKVADAEGQAVWAAGALPWGYVAPNLPDQLIVKNSQVVPGLLRLADETVVSLRGFVTGANEVGYHLVGCNWGVNFDLPALVLDLRKARPGDRAVHDPSQVIESARGIEVGHIFQLGTKYSQAMNATFTNEAGEEVPLVMGCYGLGVSRLAQAAVEQCHDQDGIVWHPAIAPYQVIITIPNMSDANQVAIAEQIYAELKAAGFEVLLDDRDERAGVKFKDADLVGIPYRIVTGRSINQGKVELVTRATKQTNELAIDQVSNFLRADLAELKINLVSVNDVP